VKMFETISTVRYHKINIELMLNGNTKQKQLPRGEGFEKELSFAENGVKIGKIV